MPVEHPVASINEFRDNVIHRLSQPVTALQGSLEVALLRPQSTEAYRRILREALEQSERLAGIVENLRNEADGSK